MAVQASQSQILNKLKTRAKGGWKKARTVEAKARGGGGLPPGLQGIVCRLAEYKLAETQKGDPYFSLTGIIVDSGDLGLDNRRVTFQWFINDSQYATVQDNLNQLSNDIQLIYPEEMPESEAGILEVMKELCENGVHILFNTNRPKDSAKMPRATIQGLAEGYEDNPASGEKDGDADDSTDEGSEAGDEATGDEESEDSTEAGAEDGDQTDADETGDGGDDDGGEAGEAENEPWEPATEDQYSLVRKVKNAKGKTVDVTSQVVVKAVSKRGQTVDVQVLFPHPKKKGEYVEVDPKTKKKGQLIKGVAWDKLEAAE